MPGAWPRRIGRLTARPLPSRSETPPLREVAGGRAIVAIGGARPDGTRLAIPDDVSPASDRTPANPVEVVATTLAGRRASDVVEVVLHRDGTLDIAVVDVRAARGQEDVVKNLRAAVRTALERRRQLHEIARTLRDVVSTAVASSAGVTLLRLCESDERVELLNAGMPPVACVFPDGRLVSLPSLSGDVGPRSPGVHPYEMMPLTSGSVWAIASDGATAGLLDDAGGLWSGLGLAEHAAGLAQISGDELAARLRLELRSEALPEDASVVIARARPRSLFSGIAAKS